MILESNNWLSWSESPCEDMSLQCLADLLWSHLFTWWTNNKSKEFIFWVCNNSNRLWICSSYQEVEINHSLSISYFLQSIDIFISGRVVNHPNRLKQFKNAFQFETKELLTQFKWIFSCMPDFWKWGPAVVVCLRMARPSWMLYWALQKFLSLHPLQFIISISAVSWIA